MPFGLVWAWLASVSHHPPLDRRYTLSPHPPTPPSLPPSTTLSLPPKLPLPEHAVLILSFTEGYSHTWHSDTICTQALAHKCKCTVHICTFKQMIHSNPERDGWVSFECQSESGGRPADLTLVIVSHAVCTCAALLLLTFLWLPPKL